MNEYRYKILNSNVEANVMEVEYQADNLPTMIIGMPLPKSNETHIDVIKRYSPVQFWLDHAAVKNEVVVGEEGVIPLESTQNTPIAPVYSASQDLHLKAIIQSVLDEMGGNTV